MNSELRYSKNPTMFTIFWVAIYAILIIVFVVFTLKIANRIRTHIIPQGKVSLTVPYSKYIAGEPISFTLTNNFNSAIYLTNNCPSEPFAIYRQTEDLQWERLHYTASIDQCPYQQRQISIPANGKISGDFNPWKELFMNPGKYRIVAFIEYYNDLPYQEFEVVAEPAVNKNTQDNDSSSEDRDNRQTPDRQDNVPPSQNSATDEDELRVKTITTDQGNISVQYSDTYITVTSVNPAAGCVYEGGRSGTQVEVTFKCPNAETQVQLEVINGVLTPKIESGGG